MIYGTCVVCGKPVKGGRDGVLYYCTPGTRVSIPVHRGDCKGKLDTAVDQAIAGLKRKVAPRPAVANGPQLRLRIKL